MNNIIDIKLDRKLGIIVTTDYFKAHIYYWWFKQVSEAPLGFSGDCKDENGGFDYTIKPTKLGNKLNINDFDDEVDYFIDGFWTLKCISFEENCPEELEYCKDKDSMLSLSDIIPYLFKEYVEDTTTVMSNVNIVKHKDYKRLVKKDFRNSYKEEVLTYLKATANLFNKHEVVEETDDSDGSDTQKDEVNDEE